MKKIFESDDILIERNAGDSFIVTNKLNNNKFLLNVSGDMTAVVVQNGKLLTDSQPNTIFIV